MNATIVQTIYRLTVIFARMISFWKPLFLLLIVCFSVNSVAFSQNDDYYKTQHLKYENFVYAPNIKSVQLNIEGAVFSMPIIQLNSDEQLRISFDDLDRELKGYYYALIHCSADWQPSDLFINEYIQGVPEDMIYEYKYSRNTRQAYIHHFLVFPNDNMKITKSGNYIIMVYEDGDKEKLVLTRRFMVTENKVDINALVLPASDPKYRFYRQELNFTISSKTYHITNPYDDLKVTILQNGRWDNASHNVQPIFVKGDEIEYRNNDGCVFKGGNEFRYFDFKNLNYQSERVSSTYVDSTGINHVILKPDKKRAFMVYLDYKEINGKAYIKNEMWGDDSDIDADYARVHFKFPYPNKLADGDVYVYGELSGWGFSRNNRLNYDETEKAYTGTIYLKQGYYNYQYAFLANNKNEGDPSVFEGDHQETENDYTILIYHRMLSDGYDRIIGARTVNSKINK